MSTSEPVAYRLVVLSLCSDLPTIRFLNLSLWFSRTILNSFSFVASKWELKLTLCSSECTWCLCSFQFFWRAQKKTILFLPEWRFGHSRSSKVTDFGANRKHACDVLLVHHSNFGPILHSFGDIAVFVLLTHPYSTVIFSVFPLHQIVHVGVSVSRCLKLFGHEIIFEVFQPMW